MDGEKGYTAWAIYDWVPYSQGVDVDPAFLLPVGEGWPRAPQGRNGYGYIYISDGQPPYGSWAEPYYELEKITEKVFCWRAID